MRLGKLPAIQFYVGDWRKDPGVQTLDFYSRGVWFEILCLMHESERRGVLLLNGAAMPENSLAKLLGISPVLCKKSLKKIITHGVASQEKDSGALMCRRMVRDEAFRQKRASYGHLGGEATKRRSPEGGTGGAAKGHLTPHLTGQQKGTPSSSSSSSASTSPIVPKGTLDIKRVGGESEGEQADEQTGSSQGQADADSGQGWVDADSGQAGLGADSDHGVEGADSDSVQGPGAATDSGPGSGSRGTVARSGPAADSRGTVPRSGKVWAPDPIQLRLGALFNRRPETRWTDKEIISYRKLGVIAEEDLVLLEKYYRVTVGEEVKYRRRDVQTLLNNLPGEVDRARNYKQPKPVLPF